MAMAEARWRIVPWAIGIAVVLLISGAASWIWNKHHSNREDITPIAKFIGALVAAWVALHWVEPLLHTFAPPYWVVFLYCLQIIGAADYRSRFLLLGSPDAFVVETDCERS